MIKEPAAMPVKWMAILPFISSFGWLYSICIFQMLFWRKTDLGSHDFGLGTLIPGWILSIGWGAFASLFLARRYLGAVSVIGFILGGFAPLLLSLIINLPFWLLGVPDQDFENAYNALFNVLTLGGVITEGRPGTAAGLANIWLGVFLGTSIGIILSARKHAAASVSKLSSKM